MIERNPQLPDPFMVLERRESFGDYARAYGDALMEHYENNGAIIVPYMPIEFDREFFCEFEFPANWKKKFGTMDGIERPTVERRQGKIAIAENHPFVTLLGNVKLAMYLQQQIASFNAHLRHGLSILFPRYLSLRGGNITWRMTETIDEGMHFDAFRGGAPLPADGRLHRLKLFINIDDEPRMWRISHDLPGALKSCHRRLPDELPDDVNVVCDVINKAGVLKSLPYHRLDYPTMSAVVANGETLAHQVMYGRRVVGVEFVCLPQDMLEPGKLSHARLRKWLLEAGYRIAGFESVR